MDKKFRVLRFIGTVYKILGIIAAVLTVVGSLAICLTSVLGGTMMNQFQRQFGGGYGSYGLMNGPVAGVIAGIIILLYGAIMTFMLYGLGEGIYLLLALEENTRTTATYLQQYSADAAPPAPAE